MDTRRLSLDEHTILARRHDEERDTNTPAGWVAEDCLGLDGQSVDADELLELARELSTFVDGSVEDALEALLSVAFDREDRDRVVSLVALDEPIPYALSAVDEPIPFTVAVDDVTAWEQLFASDPEQPEHFVLTEADVDDFAEREFVGAVGAIAS